MRAYPQIENMLKKYECKTQTDYINALKEVIQEIALLGLWRSKFFEHATFYGGSALRILYELNRFSEDLDFSLLTSKPDFDLTPYNQAIKKELESFGFEVTVENKIKNEDSTIESAFIKANTKLQLLNINAPELFITRLHAAHSIKIKMEVDTDPPLHFSTETKYHLQPIPFPISVMILPDLFAGKIHALLCRPWVKRVKGRDWYDLIWYLSQQTPVNLTHLHERLVQSQAWEPSTPLSRKALISLLNAKINDTDFENAKNDIAPFIADKSLLTLWSKAFFNDLILKINCYP